MSGLRAWGLAGALTLLACGGRSQEKPSDPDVAGSGNSGNGGRGGATTTGDAGKLSGSGAGAGGGGASAAGGADVASGAGGAGANAAAGADMAGGAGGAEPCQGIDPSCVPGETVCDRRKGTLTTCGDCGAPTPAEDGAPCVRLLASDKESNGVCVVRGQTELQCWPTWGDAQVAEVPSDTVELLLPDDYADSPYPMIPPVCSKRADSSFSCLHGAVCAQAAQGDNGAVCGLCSGEPYCEGNVLVAAVPAKPLLALTITDGMVFLLSPNGVQTSLHDPARPAFWKGAPRNMWVDHQGAGCVESTLGELALFQEALDDFKASAWRGPFRKLVPTTLPQACVLDDARQVRCGDVLADAVPKPLPLEGVVDVVASAGLVCALTVDGHVHCYDGKLAPRDMPAGW
jgi:hypothetical protein